MHAKRSSKLNRPPHSKGSLCGVYLANFCLTNITTMNRGVPECGFGGNSKPDRRIARGHLDVVLQP